MLNYINHNANNTATAAATIAILNNVTSNTKKQAIFPFC